MSNTSKTIQLLLEASTARKPTEDAAKARESLYRPDSLPCIAVELDGATISVNSAPPPTPAPLSDKDKPLLKPVIPSTQGIAQYNDVTQVSLRLGALVADRSECFDAVVQLFQALKSAVDDFNEANLNVATTSISYNAVERYYGTHIPGIPNIMRGMRDSMITPLTASPSHLDSSG